MHFREVEPGVEDHALSLNVDMKMAVSSSERPRVDIGSYSLTVIFGVRIIPIRRIPHPRWEKR